MNYWQILLLAVIQGAAELLPVSSSAHVIVTAKLMKLDPSSTEFVFLLVMLHTGTMFAVIVYFWPRWRRLFTAPAGAPAEGSMTRMQYLMMIVLATACTGFVGLGLKAFIERVVLVRMLGHEKGEVEHLFKSLPLIAAALFAVGVFILVAGLRETKSEVQTVSERSSFWIGVVQGLCLPFRGFSRSGATISTALLRGIARPLAEDFSFALAVVLTPPVIAYSLYSHYSHMKTAGVSVDVNWVELLRPGLVGMVFSFLAGLVALRFLSAVLENGRWKYFGYYCLAASGGVFAVALAGF